MLNLLFVIILPGDWFKYEMSSVEYLKLPALQYAHCQCIFRPQAVLCSTIWFMGFQSETCNKFFPSLKVQTQHWCRITPFFKCEMVGRFTEQNSQESQLSRGGGFAKKGQKDLRIFQPGISWASGISKEGPSGRRQIVTWHLNLGFFSRNQTHPGL